MNDNVPFNQHSMDRNSAFNPSAHSFNDSDRSSFNNAHSTGFNNFPNHNFTDHQMLNQMAEMKQQMELMRMENHYQMEMMKMQNQMLVDKMNNQMLMNMAMQCGPVHATFCWYAA